MSLGIEVGASNSVGVELAHSCSQLNNYKRLQNYILCLLHGVVDNVFYLMNDIW